MEPHASFRVELFDRFDEVDTPVSEGRKWLGAIGDFFTKKAALDKVECRGNF